MMSKPGSPTRKGQPRQRFFPPVTPVDERIDQVTAYCKDKQGQAEWLKRTLHEHWKVELPQPFVVFDEEQDAFVLVWQSDDYCRVVDEYVNSAPFADNLFGDTGSILRPCA